MIIKMFETKGKEVFLNSLTAIKDLRAKAQIIKRIERLRSGNRGDYKNIELNLYELRITTGKGWRVYYIEQDNEIIILMLTGNKSNQKKDIEKVKGLIDEYINRV